MISEIKFKGLSTCSLFSYAHELPFFKQNKKILFKPGLNILFGPNGCGKSTILKMIALSLAAEQGGRSVQTTEWLRQIADINVGKKDKATSCLQGARVIHDGQPILYTHPRVAVGMRNGRLDDDFMLEGIKDTFNKTSTGLKTIDRLNGILAVLHGDASFPEKIESKLPTMMNSSFQKRAKIANAILAPKIQLGQKTIVLDEPETGLSVPVQGNLINAFYEGIRSDKYQIIVASHSPFVLGLPGANYIDLEPGYLEHTESCIADIHKRIQARQMALKKL